MKLFYKILGTVLYIFFQSMVVGQDGIPSLNAVFRVVEESEYKLGHVQTHPLAVVANSV